MTARTSAGTKLLISAAAPVTFDEAGFEALSFTEIKEITNIGGNFSRAYNLVTHNPLATRATVKKKGSFNSGSLTVDMAVDRADAGQELLDAALASDSDYSFKLLEQDGSAVYFQGVVMGNPVTPGGVDSINARTATIEITADTSGNDFVLVEAS